MSRSLRLLNAVLAVLFFGCALLQIEDDDPEIYANPSMADVVQWIAFYGLTGLLFLLAAFRRFPRVLLGVVAAFSVFLLIQTGPGLIENFTDGEFNLTKRGMNPGNPSVEQSREFFGALLVLISAVFVHRQRRKFAGTPKHPGGRAG